jgi:tight adherence protein C
MTRLAAVSVITLWVGATLVLSELRWFRRLPLLERLRPFEPGGMRRTSNTTAFTNRSFGDVLTPLAAGIGERVSKGFGVSEELALRLERVHSTEDVNGFRTRQVGWAAAGFGTSTLLMVAVQPPAAVILFFSIATPLVAFLALEQQLAKTSEAHQRRLFLELPIITEQLGMLLSSGYSINAALSRVAERGDGACVRDIARLNTRMRQGISSDQALREWARIGDISALHQLVSVLTLHDEAGDLGHLISTEARSMRRESQRELVERIERRNQQVWIPVTVATLVPGVIFLSVPFMNALSDFGAL